MEEIAALIRQLDEAREKIQLELIDLDENLPVSPGWTVKHLLAHFIGWDDVATAALCAYTQGQMPAPATVPGIDLYNAQAVAMRDALSYNHIVKEWELARDQLKAALLAVPEEKVDAPLSYPWGPTGTVRELAAIYAQHELEHAAELHELKARLARPAQNRVQL
jgi:hypothetical protein